MPPELVVIAAWAQFLSLVGIFCLTFMLRYFVVGGEWQVSQMPRFFVKKEPLTARGQLLWKVRNVLLAVVAILLPVLWFARPPS